MSSWIDDDYAVQTFMLLPRYKQVGSMPLRLNARCPICGDSQKDEYKARFWYYYYNNIPFVHCYNCDHTSSFSNFLREHDEEMYKKYQLEKFKENGSMKPVRELVPEKPIEKPKAKTVEGLAFTQCLADLPDTHPIIKYVAERKIPVEHYNRLFFTAKWQELCNSVVPETFKAPRQEYRLVIPIYNKDGKIESFQGRALGPSSIKYMTIKTDENASKVYGMDLIDDSLDYVFVLEGPLDTLFLRNAIAISGGSLNLESVPYPDKRIWVMDNEPRHPDTIKRMQSLIEAGEKVVFWDQALWESKDINDMVKDEGATQDELMDYLLTNHAKGLFARARMLQYSKL